MTNTPLPPTPLTHPFIHLISTHNIKGAPGKLFADATEIEIESQDEIEDQEESAEQSSEGW